MEKLTESIAWPPAYKVRKHRLARHVKLRASRQNGLEITIPYRFNQKELPAILEEHRHWIIKQLVKLQGAFSDELPDLINFLAIQTAWPVRYVSSGKRIQLIESQGSGLAILGNIDDKERVRERLTEWVRAIAKERLPAILDLVSRDMNIGYSEVTIRNQKTQWGSCTTGKAINLNYRLIFLPPELVRHIMVHELCHTVHHNHSKRFWALVAKHDATWIENKHALRLADKYMPAWL